MKVINLTPHAFNLYSTGQVGEKGMVKEGEEPILTIPSTGLVRCAVSATSAGTAEVCGVIVQMDRKVFGELEGLPTPQDGVIYLTSSIAASAAWKKGRVDVACPGDAVRAADGSGKVVGSLGISLNPDGG